MPARLESDDLASTHVSVHTRRERRVTTVNDGFIDAFSRFVRRCTNRRYKRVIAVIVRKASICHDSAVGVIQGIYLRESYALCRPVGLSSTLEDTCRQNGSGALAAISCRRCHRAERAARKFQVRPKTRGSCTIGQQCPPDSVRRYCYEDSATRRALLGCKNMCISMERRI